MKQLKETEAQVAAILKQLAEDMNFFPKETAQLMYARQLAGTEIRVGIPEEVVLDKKMKTEEGNKHLQKMMEEAKLKWDYASESQKKNVRELEAMIAESNEKIKQLYTQ